MTPEPGVLARLDLVPALPPGDRDARWCEVVAHHGRRPLPHAAPDRADRCGDARESPPLRQPVGLAGVADADRRLPAPARGRGKPVRAPWRGPRD